VTFIRAQKYDMMINELTADQDMAARVFEIPLIIKLIHCVSDSIFGSITG
jgi:hypothetical protein